MDPFLQDAERKLRALGLLGLFHVTKQLPKAALPLEREQGGICSTRGSL